MTTASVAWLVALAAFAAAWEPAGLKERYALYAQPLLAAALPIWLARGAPRPRIATAVVALSVVGLVAILPLDRILDGPSFLGNAYGLHLLDRLGGTRHLVAATLAAAAIAATAVLAPLAVARVALPVAAATLLAAASWAAADTVRDRSRGADRIAGLSPTRFADRAAGSDARALFLNTTTYHAETRFGRPYEQWAPYWLAELWNRSLRGTASLGLAEPAPIAQQAAGLDWATGRVALDPEPRYVLTDRRFRVVGEEIAGAGPFRLTRVDSPLRLASAVENADRDGFIETGASFDLWEEADAVEVVVDVRGPTRVEVAARPARRTGQCAAARRHQRIPPRPADVDAPARVVIPGRPEPSRVQVRLSREPARVRFEPR